MDVTVVPFDWCVQTKKNKSCSMYCKYVVDVRFGIFYDIVSRVCVTDFVTYDFCGLAPGLKT